MGLKSFEVFSDDAMTFALTVSFYTQALNASRKTCFHAPSTACVFHAF